ncbi:MAG: hypothetical protein V9G19_21715 [Tetrasphaera sp.]
MSEQTPAKKTTKSAPASDKASLDLGPLADLVDSRPVYAYLGMADLVFEKIREELGKAGELAEKSLKDLTDLPSEAREYIEKFLDQLPSSPKEAADKSAEFYDDLADRGEKLVERIQSQQSVKDLIDGVNKSTEHGVAAITGVRDSAGKLPRAAADTVESVGEED